MARLMLNEELWSKLRGIMRQHRIYEKPNLRMIVEAMLYRMRVGCPWRDLPGKKIRQSENLLVATQQKFIWQLMPVDYQLNLILLAVRYMTVKPPQILLKSYLYRSLLLPIRVMTARLFANKFVKNHPYPSYPGSKIPRLETAT
jgi:hypothetical protein